MFSSGFNPGSSVAYENSESASAQSKFCFSQGTPLYPLSHSQSISLTLVSIRFLDASSYFVNCSFQLFKISFSDS